MKAATTILIDVNMATLDAKFHPLVKLRAEPGRRVPTPHLPVGTVIEGDKALQLVMCGQANPIDQECSDAAGMTPEQLVAAQRAYAAAVAGISGAKDLEMFMFGAIEGYGPGTTDKNPVYIHGPRWNEWQAAEAARVQKIEGDVI